jgi:hypothetical protein
MNEPSNLSNLGITILNRPKLSPGMAVSAPRTFILTGVALSGTSMLAQAVKAAGIFIGMSADDIVHEDLEMAAALTAKSDAALESVIHARNVSHQVWAFKLPDLHKRMEAKAIAKFRNPHLVVTFRDIAAIAQRHIMSERVDAWPVLEEAASGQLALLKFIRQLKCPLMLVSYEKATAFPGSFIAALTDFIGAPVTQGRGQDMLGAVEPDRGAYIRSKRRQYAGAIDYIVDGILSGWARDTASMAPVPLTLILDDLPVLNFTADQMRPDLAALGYGEGRHGFSVNIRPFLHRPHAIARVNVAGRTFELEKSGKPLAQLISR